MSYKIVKRNVTQAMLLLHELIELDNELAVGF